jgi:hypothetical protein
LTAGKTTFGITIEPINEGKANTLFNRNQSTFTKTSIYQIKNSAFLETEIKGKVWDCQSRKINFSIENE